MKGITNNYLTKIQSISFWFCILLMFSCSRTFTSKQEDLVIGLQPLNGFDQALMDSIKCSLESTYNCRVVFLKNRILPKEAFVQIKTARYRADSLLRFLLKLKPDTVDYMMGLTTQDISTTKKDRNGRMLQPESKYRDWGVFGLGFRPGKSCIISSYRIRHEDSGKYMNRLIKICVHEFGHNLGLHHCPTPGCVMQDAVETIKTVDNGNRELCSWCRSRISL